MTIIGRFLLIAGLIASPFAVEAHDSQTSAECEQALQAALDDFTAQNGEEKGVHDMYVDQIIANDRPNFADLITPDPEKNLFARAPLTAMSGAQRMLALVLSRGVEQRRVGFYSEPVEVYPFLTDGPKETQGYRVEGSWKAATEIVSFLRSQAEGDRSGRTVPLLYGPGGTGKSETRTVIEKGAEFHTLYTPQYYIYSFDWIHMNELKEIVKRWGPDVDVIPAPRNTSPIAILPPQFQQQALKMAALKGYDMLGGIYPSHTLNPDSWSRTIVRYIIEQYTEQLGRPLTMKETLQYISKHVRLRRSVISSKYRQFPIIDVQGVSADHSQLFVSSNPIVQAISPEGKSDPFAYSFSGALFQGDGNMVVFEEMTRSDASFLQLLMNGLESRELQSAGAAKEPWDAFVMGISNKESYEALLAKGGMKAFRQRLQIVDMVQPSQPQLIARTILYGYKDNLWMQPLDDDKAEWVRADLDKLFPIPEKLEPGHVVGPERRYRVRIGQGPRAVEVSPHTFRFMAHIIATTRFETDKERAYQVVPTRLVHEKIFTDPIERIRFWDGKLTDVQPEERRTLEEMTNKLNEGHNGIVHRNALGWLRKAIQLVRSDSRYGMTLTPSVLLKVFEEEGFRTDGFIHVDDHNQESHYKRLGRLVLKELLIPAIAEDINFAYSSEQGSLKEVYPVVIEELMAVARHANAVEYHSAHTGRVTKVLRERVEFIKEHYRKRTGREIPLDQILFFHMNQTKLNGATPEPSPEIAEALSAYMAKKTLERAKASGATDLGEALRSGQGSKETLSLVSNLVKHMEKIGYNRTAAMDAFDLDELAKQPLQTADQQ